MNDEARAYNPEKDSSTKSKKAKFVENFDSIDVCPQRSTENSVTCPKIGNLLTNNLGLLEFQGKVHLNEAHFCVTNIRPASLR